MLDLRRCQFITLLGGAATGPLAALALPRRRQPSYAMNECALSQRKFAIWAWKRHKGPSGHTGCMNR